jgi:hypothetical protein
MSYCPSIKCRLWLYDRFYYLPPVIPAGSLLMLPAFTGRQYVLDNPTAAVDIVGSSAVSTEIILTTRYNWGGVCIRSYYMANRPSNLADRLSKRREPDHGFSRETFRLPVEAARLKAREILNQFPQGGYMTIVEQWRQLPDGQIEFTMRSLRASD